MEIRVRSRLFGLYPEYQNFRQLTLRILNRRIQLQQQVNLCFLLK